MMKKDTSHDNKKKDANIKPPPRSQRTRLPPYQLKEVDLLPKNFGKLSISKESRSINTRAQSQPPHVLSENLLSSGEEGSPRAGPPIEKCSDLLKQLSTEKHAKWFLNPVDPVKENIPNYPSVISKPMDFFTITRKIESGLYDCFSFADDMRLVFKNAMTYMPARSRPVHKAAIHMEQKFLEKFDILMKEFSSINEKVPLDSGSSNEEDKDTTLKVGGELAGPIHTQAHSSVLSPVVDIPDPSVFEMQQMILALQAENLKLISEKNELQNAIRTHNDSASGTNESSPTLNGNEYDEFFLKLPSDLPPLPSTPTDFFLLVKQQFNLKTKRTSLTLHSNELPSTFSTSKELGKCLPFLERQAETKKYLTELRNKYRFVRDLKTRSLEDLKTAGTVFTSTGGPGLGKTTFSRLAVATFLFNKSNLDLIDDDKWKFSEILKHSLDNNLQLRITFSEPAVLPEEIKNPLLSFTARFLFQLLKYSFHSFESYFKDYYELYEYAKRINLTLKDVIQFLHPIIRKKGDPLPLILINFDELNVVYTAYGEQLAKVYFIAGLEIFLCVTAASTICIIPFLTSTQS
jgi:hypothetical protein